jgi:PAS domain S-box-containing protein
MASRASGLAKARGKVVAPTQSHLIGLELEKTIPLFPFLQEIEMSFPTFFTEIHLAVEAAQILSLALLPYHKWGYVLNGILRALHFSHIPLYDSSILGLGYTAVLAICCVMIVFMLVCIFITTSVLLRNADDVGNLFFGVNSIRFVRLVMYSFTSFLFIPIIQNMLSLAYCNAETFSGMTWYPDTECGSSIATFGVAVCVVGITLLFGFAYIMNTLIFESAPMSRHYYSRVHSLLDLPNMLFKLVSVVLMHYFYARSSLVYHAVWMSVSSLCMAAAFIFIPPYFRKVTTQIHVTSLLLCCAYAIFAASSEAPQTKTEFLSDRHVDVGLVLALFPLLTYIFWRYASLARTSSVFVNGMEHLHEGVIAQQTTHFPRNLPELESLFDNNQDLYTEILEGAHVLDHDEPGEAEFHFTLPYIDYINHEYDVELSTRFLVYFRKFTQLEPTKYQIAYGATIYMKGIQQYRSSSFLRLSFGNFLLGHAGKARLALQQINIFRGIEASLSERYQGYKLHARLSVLLHLGQSTRLEALSRAKRRHREALHHTMEFWQLLISDDVDKMALSNSTRNILSRKEDVLQIYRNLLTKNANNLDILACYTSFCETLLNDNEATQLCLQCLREGRELKTANTMRGAKVKGDTGTMTQIPLDFDDSNEDSRKQGEGVRQASWLLFLCTLGLILLIGGFLASIIVTHLEAQRNVKAVVGAGKLRGLVTQCLVATNDLQAYVLAGDAVATNRTSYELLALQSDFTTLHNELTFGEAKPKTESQFSYFRDMTTTISGTNLSANFWTVASLVPVAIRDIAAHPYNSTYYSWVQRELPAHVSVAANHTTALWESAYSANYSLMQLLTGVFIGTVLIVLCIVCLIMFHNIHKIESVRSEIFGLFTLIPQRTVRKLFRDSRRKYTDIDTFFNLSTRKKLVELIGADQDDQAKLQLELNDAHPANSAHSDSMSQSGGSDTDGSRRGSVSASVTGSNGGESVRGKRRRRKNQAEDQAATSGSPNNSKTLAKVSAALMNDVAFTEGTWWTFALIAFVGIGVLVISSIAVTHSHELAEIEFQKSQNLFAADDVTSTVRDVIDSARAFIFTGHQRYFEKCVVASSKASAQSATLLETLIHSQPDASALQSLFWTEQLFFALSEYTNIALRLSVATYTATAVLQSAPFSATALARLTWGNEETLQLTSVAPAWGVKNVRTGLIDGSALDLAKSAANQLAIAKSMMSSENFYQLVNSLLAETRKLAVVKTLETSRDTSRSRLFGMTLAAFIVSALGLAFTVYLIVVATTSPVISKRRNMLTLIVLALGIATMTALSLASFVRIASDQAQSPNPEFLDDAFATKHKWENAIYDETDFPRYFLASGGNQLWNYKYRFVYFTDFGPSVVNPIEDFERLTGFSDAASIRQDAFTVDSLNGMIAQVNRMKRLNEIAMVLTNAATKSASDVNNLASMTINATYLNRIDWNFAAESDYHTTFAKYRAADEGLFYNTRTSDLTLVAAAQLNLSAGTLFSHRFDDLLASVNNVIRGFFAQIVQAGVNQQVDSDNTTYKLLLSAAVVAAVVVVADGVLLLSVFFTYSDSDKREEEANSTVSAGGAGASAGASNTTSASITDETVLPFWAYLVVALLLLASAIIVGVEVKLESDVVIQLNQLTKRTWFGSNSYSIAQRMVADPSYFFEGREEMKRIYRKVLDANAALYFKSKGEYYLVGKNKDGDADNFDRFSWYNLGSFFGTAASTTSSSSAQGLLEGSTSGVDATPAPVPLIEITSDNPYSCNITEGTSYLLRISRGVSLVFDNQWTELLQRMSYASQGDVAAIASEMQALYKPLLLGLTISIDEAASHHKDRVTMWMAVVIAIAASAALLVILIHLVAVTRFIDFLSEEENSARLMLRIIPQDARESNKQIQSYLESGRVKQASDDLNSAIASMSTLPVIAIDQKGIIMRFTQAAENVFGYSSSEVVGMNVVVLMPEEYAKNHDTYLSNYRRTKVKHVIDSLRRLKGRRKNGDLFPLELRVMELKFGDESVYIGFAKDISAELDLAMQDQLNKYVLDMSRDPIISMDSYGILLSVNQAVSAVFGYTKDEMLRENIKMLMPSEIALNHDGYLARYRETGVKHVIDNERSVQGQRKNGEIFQASVTVREIRQHGEAPIFIGFVKDVTEAHEAAMQNEVNDIISDLSPVPIIAINEKGTFVKFSRAASQLFQYSKDELVGRGQNVQILVPGKFGDHNRFMKTYFVTGVKKVIGTTRNIIAQKRDKTIFPAMLTLREIRKESMNPVFLGYIVDITQTLQLEESGKLASEIMRFSMIPIIVTSTKGIITSFNDAAEALFGYTREEALGANVKILVPPAVSVVHDQIIDNYVKSREKSVVGLNRVVQAVKKNGELFPVDLSLREVPESADGEGCFFAYLRDVTSHRETLQQFMINDSIVQLSTIPIIAISNKGMIESFSPAAEDCFGYSVSELIGENIKMLMPLEISEKHDEYLRRYRKTGIKTIIDSSRVVSAKRRDGTIFNLEVSVKEIKKEGTQNSFVGYCRDTSRDQLLEEQKDLGAMIRDLSTIPILIISHVGDLTYVNDAFCTEFQYSREEALQLNIKHLMPEHIAVHHDGYLAAYVARGKDAALASTIVNQVRRLIAVRKDGTQVEVEAKVAEIRSERSGTLQFVGFVRNLGTQLQLEQANYTIDTITNLSLIPIVAIDHRGIVIKFSGAAERAFEFTSSEVLGNNIKMLMPEEIAEKHDGFLRTYFKTRLKTVVGATVRQEGRRKNGTRFPLELSVREIVKQGQNPLFIGYCRDASEDTALERAMQLSNLVTALCPIPIVVISRMGIIQTFNVAACDTFGHTKEEALGQDISILMLEDDAAYHTKYLKTYAKTKIKSAIDAVKMRQAKRKDGLPISVEVSVKEIIPSSGDDRHICYLGFIRDLSAVQELEQAGMVNDTIASISAVPLIVINMQGIVSRFSNSAETVFGFSASDVIGRNVKMLMPQATADNHDGYLNAYRKRTKGNMERDTEVTIERIVRGRRRTGEEFPAELTIREVRKQGQESMFVGYLIDMSSRYEIVRRKLVTEASVELCSSPIISMSTTGIVRSFNEAAEDCFGYTKNEIIGTNIKILMPRKTADHHDQFLANYLKTGVKNVVDRNRDVMAKRKNGKRFAAVISVREVIEGDDHFYVGYVMDRSSVAALEQASLVNDAIISMTTTSVIAIDEMGTVKKFSPSAEQLFGYRAAEVIGFNIMMLMPEPHRTNHDGYLEHYRRTGVKKVIGKTTKNLKGIRKDGSDFNCELTVTEISLEGVERSFVAAVQDITERVAQQAETAVAKASEEMSTRALIAIDEIGTILRCNESALSLFGYEAAEVHKKNVKMLMPEEIAINHDGYLSKYRETGIKKIIDSSRMVIGCAKGGRRFEVEVHVKEVKLSNGTSLYLGYLDDVSTKKEISIAACLAESVMALIPAPLIIMNAKGIVTHFNSSAERVFEFTSSQVVGRNVKLLMPPEISKVHDEYLSRYFKTGEKHIIDSLRDVEGETKTGQRVKLRVSVREIQRQGNEVMFVGFCQPI